MLGCLGFLTLLSVTGPGLSWSLVTLTLLRSTGQLFGRMFISLGFSDIFWPENHRGDAMSSV